MTLIEELITALVQTAPEIDPSVVGELRDSLQTNGAALALSISRVLQLVGERVVDPGIALPALAMACATLVDERLTEREREAARFEIETLLPVPGARPPRIETPDIPVARLIRGPRRQP